MSLSRSARRQSPRPSRLSPLLLALALVWAMAPTALAAQSYDILIRNGRLLDGTGNPWYYGDVAISGDRIAAVGDLENATATRIIDATGLYLAPGFIDVHSHAGGGLETPELSPARPQLAQGITTVVINPDGGGPVDLVAQRDSLLRDGLGVNAAQLVPHGSVRREVIGNEDRAPTDAEMQRMRDLVRAGMQAGAYGLSSGPFYAPGSYSTTEELVELARVAAEYGGVYTSHIRDESDYTIGLVAAVDEVITVAREAQLPGIVTHMKALGPRVWGFSSALVSRIDRARSEGVEVFADQYPYEASQTGLSAALLPRWAQVGGGDALEARLDDPATLDSIRVEMVDNLDRRGGADRIQIARYEPEPSFEGMTLAAIAEQWGVDAITAAIRLIREDSPGIVSFNMHDDDIATLMSQEWMMTGSDGTLVPMNQGVPHPRAYGTYPRKIRRYVVEERVLEIGAAIRSMTGLPAAVFDMPERGLLRAGTIADVIVFDLEQVRDLATYAEPHQLSEGMVHVFVNGVAAIDSGEFTGAMSGRVLRRGEIE
ncbi:MAG: D-aminoacylase [Gemmatimonadota bacterium]